MKSYTVAYTHINISTQWSFYYNLYCFKVDYNELPSPGMELLPSVLSFSLLLAIIGKIVRSIECQRFFEIQNGECRDRGFCRYNHYHHRTRVPRWRLNIPIHQGY